MMNPNVPITHQQRLLFQKLKSGGVELPKALLQGSSRAEQVAAEKERKRKNREFAKRSREKRKNEHKHLEEELFLLQQENGRLRQIVQDKIPDHAQKILKNCCEDHPLHHAAVKQGVNDALAMSDFHMLENLIKEQQSFCMTDPMQPDNPIVYASQSFYQMTEYTKEQTLGRNCRFLQGKDTDPKSVALIRESIKNGKDTSVNLLNYKADETPFWNQFFIVALRNHSGKIVNFVSKPMTTTTYFGISILLLSLTFVMFVTLRSFVYRWEYSARLKIQVRPYPTILFAK
jgi:PAS domain-containing protein